jgi:ribosome-associated toxin RatA of RatAB toxin-antitoxin module
MNPIARAQLVLGTALALVLASGTASAVEFNEKEKARLAAGKTVKKPMAKAGKNGVYGGSAYTLIDAPADLIWAAIEDWDSYKKIYPKTVSVKEVSRKGNKSLVRMEQGHKLISVAYHVEVQKDPAKKMIKFKLVKNKPHDIEETKGYWRLFPQSDGRTLVAYVVAVRVPGGLVNLLGQSLSDKLARALLGVPGDLKKWVEGPAGNRYRVMTAKK